MSERVIVESTKNKPFSKKTLLLFLPIIVKLINVVGYRVAKYISGLYEDKMEEHCYLKGFIWNADCSVCAEYKVQSELWERVGSFLKNFSPALSVASILCAAGIAAYMVTFLYRRKTKITVTDRRLYGYAAFGKKVDLPLRSIRKIAKGKLKSIAVSTDSEKYVFPGLEGRDDLHTRISQCLSGSGGGAAPQYFSNDNRDSVTDSFLNFFDNDKSEKDEADINNKKNSIF